MTGIDGNLEPRNKLKADNVAAKEIASKAIKYHSQGDICKAEQYYKLYLETGFTDPTVISNYGVICKKRGRIDEAIRIYRKAIYLYPNSQDAYYNLANILREVGQLKEAEMSIRKAIKIKPDFALAYSNLGNILRDLGDLKEAKRFTREAIKLNPDLAIAHSNLGIILYDLGDFKEAKKCWIRALEIDSRLDLANFYLGRLFHAELNYDLALKYLKRSSLGRSQSLYLGTLLTMDKEKEFKKHSMLLAMRNICNPEIGGIIQHANIIYRQNNPSPFCNDAKKYILLDKINEEIFSSEHCDQIISYFYDNQYDRREQTLLEGGLQSSGNIFELDYPFVKSMKESLENKIRMYKLRFKNCQEGFIENWPDDYYLRGWMIAMKKGGFLRPHNHPHGWISGSFYLKVPEPNLDDNEGAIAFSYQGPKYPRGSFDLDFDLDIKKVKTREICIFPSSLFHHTIPFQSEDERICFVFDLAPKSSSVPD